MSKTVITNTPRPGETTEQIAARTAPHGDDAGGRARLLYVTSPQAGRFLLNLQTGPDGFRRIEITREQIVGFILDGIKILFCNTLTDRVIAHRPPARSDDLNHLSSKNRNTADAHTLTSPRSEPAPHPSSPLDSGPHNQGLAR